MRATKSSGSTCSSFSRCVLTSSLIWQCRHSAIGRLVGSLSSGISWGGRVRRSSRGAVLFEHDLFRKPASTFRDHALAALLLDRLGRHDLDAEAGEADI